MTSAFYRSSADGWRVGLVDVTNTNKAVVHDHVIHVQETCRVADIFAPPPEAASLLAMHERPEEFFGKSDAALMSPSPLMALPSLIELLRQRNARTHDSSVSIGDNVEVFVHHRDASLDIPVPSRSPERPGSVRPVEAALHDGAIQTVPHSLARTAVKAVAALRASSSSQIVIGSGLLPADFNERIAALAMETVNAPPGFVARLKAAQTIIRAFTTTVVNEKKLTAERLSIDFSTASLLEPGGSLRVLSANFEHMLLDLRHFGVTDGSEGLVDNFTIFSLLIYAFNHEEKERVYLNRKQVDFHTQRVIKDLDRVNDLRKMYAELGKAMEVVGVEFAARLSLYSRVACVLHLQEIDFFEDGSIANLTAVKAVARLLQVDFNALQRILVSKDACIAASKWLYESTLMSLVDKINAALGASSMGALQGGATSADTSNQASLVILQLPPPPSTVGKASSLDATDIPLAALYEDLAQCMFRSSELESIEWQRAGLFAPDALQAILDSSDNFSLLKVIKGRGGVLQVAQTIANLGASQATDVFAALSKSKLIHCSLHDSTVTIPHTFGSRTYRLQQSTSAVGNWGDTIFADRYTELREFFFSNSEVETQEVLYLFDQRREHLVGRLAMDVASLQPLLSMLQAKVHEAHFWWVRGVELEVGFQGGLVEDQLKLNMMEPIVKLRKVFPKRFIPCRPEYFASAYRKLLPREAPNGGDGNALSIAESILTEVGVAYLVSPDAKVLVEGYRLVDLQNMYSAKLSTCASLVQSFARILTTSKLIRSRFLSWQVAIGELQKQRDFAVAAHRGFVENTELHKLQRCELVEKETTQRLLIRDQCWTEWVALQTSAQQSMQSIIQHMVTRTIRAEESSIRKATAVSHKQAVHQLTARIQNHLLAQGSHLDHVIAKKEQQHANAYRRLEKEYEAHKRILAKKQEEEETKLERKQTLASKEERINRVAEAREKQREELRQKLWFRQEKERVAKEQMEKARRMIATTMEEQIALETIERTMAQRVADEVAEEQRRIREEQALTIQEAKRQREQQLMVAAKANERYLVRKEIQRQRQSDAEQQRKRRQEQLLLASQERERRVMERVRKEDEKHQKTLTRSLLKAHTLLHTPILFEQSSDGAVKLVKAALTSPRTGSRGQSVNLLSASASSAQQSFMLSNGKETHPRLFSPEVARALVESSPARMFSHSPPRVHSAMTASMSPRRRLDSSGRFGSPTSQFSL